MKIQNKQLSKKVAYLSLAMATTMLSAACFASNYDIKLEPQEAIKQRLQLFDLDKFANSFEKERDLKAQMQDRMDVWYNARLQQHPAYIGEAIRAAGVSKLTAYMPYYLSKILSIDSGQDLKVKMRCFDDCANLLSVIYKFLDDYENARLNRAISTINLEASPLSSMFLRRLAGHSINKNLSKLPSSIARKTDAILEDDKWSKRPDKHLADQISLDREILQVLSQSENLDFIRDMLALHNLRNEL